MSKRRLPQAPKPQGRSCGQCNECCTALGVPEIQKSTFQMCSHVMNHKCDCYATRPTACQEYKCLWLLGAIDSVHRPDRVGVVFDRTESLRKLEEKTGLTAIAARITRDTMEGTQIIKSLSSRFLVVLIDSSDRRRILGPAHAAGAIESLVPSV